MTVTSVDEELRGASTHDTGAVLVSASLLLLLLLPRSPHSDVHTSLLDEGSSFAEII